jgi:hypothetical protein
MTKKASKIILYSFITFCVINFLSLVVSIIINKLNGTFPKFEIGFPFTFYYQFLIDNNELQHGFKKGLLVDIFFSIIFTYLLLKIINNKKLTTNNSI